MAHYFSENQKSKISLKKIKISLKKISFELYTGSGVFSKGSLDKGTEILINNSIIESGWDILDMGCGIGVVGIAVKLMYPATRIIMADINERAVSLSRKNIELNKLEGITAQKSNLYSGVQGKFNAILTNPPMAAGKETCFGIIEKAPYYLKENGLLQLVARHKKGGESLKKKMEEVFGNVTESAKESGFRVYVSQMISHS